MVWFLAIAILACQESEETWWSFRPLEEPAVPRIQGAANPVDAFIRARLRERGLSPSPSADRPTLIRRVTFDLTGLPPTPEDVARFVKDRRPGAYERLVDRLLASPRYGERWGRHWLDVARYADTHGFDKDKPRPNAWPYRDWVIRSFNEDMRFDLFVADQIAGDPLATGFLAAGPWDFVGHTEVRNGTTEKARVRNLDRAEMVAATMGAFTSLTVHCARCHDHKFDPITQEEYYGLQAVFAGIDRADIPYDRDREVAAERARLEKEVGILDRTLESLRQEANVPGQERLGDEIRELESKRSRRPEYGYHSRIERSQDVEKWVQVDLGGDVHIRKVMLAPCHDAFNGIGPGFGFPVRYRVEVGNGKTFRVIADHTGKDVANPGIVPRVVETDVTGRFVRVTATRLALRSNDFIFSLAELEVIDADGANRAAGAKVSSFDSIEAPARWRRGNLVDGIYPAKPLTGPERTRLGEKMARKDPSPETPEIRLVRQEAERTRKALEALGPRPMVYSVGSTFKPQGRFISTNGKIRSVRVLQRGDVRTPGAEARPGGLSLIRGVPHRFGRVDGEAGRRAGLAKWLTRRDNPLIWRSMANRIWHHHFGTGIVSTPNDFGRMGSPPSHPHLLDWLASRLREGGSIKDLHRLIVTSATYRQVSDAREEGARVDGGNRLLWRMNRRRLEAEALRDSVLSVAGRLDPRMGGPAFRAFGFKDDHSPVYDYMKHDPSDRSSWRRSVYRLTVRSVPDPFMQTLDCPDPSGSVGSRGVTITPLQALSLLNNRFMVEMAGAMARRLEGEEPDARSRIDRAFRLAYGRPPSAGEAAFMADLVEREGLFPVCRALLNSNEFVFVD